MRVRVAALGAVGAVLHAVSGAVAVAGSVVVQVFLKECC